MSFAMPSLDAISNLAAAQQSLSAANQAYDNWKARYEQNGLELQTLLALQSALNVEKSKVEHAVAEGTKLLHETWMSLGRPPAPAALPESPPASSPPQSAPSAPKKAAKILSQDERDAMSEDVRNAFLSGRMSKEQERALSKEEKKERKALKKVAHDERKEHRSPEQQAKIDARVAAMKAGRAKASPARALDADLAAAAAEAMA
jgi:hypothetical protein